MSPKARGLVANPYAFSALLGERSQYSVAKQAGISRSHLSEVIAGHKGANEDQARRIADAMDVPVEALFPELAGFMAPEGDES